MAYQSKVNFDVHLAIVKGNVVGKKRVPVRVHSSCMTGDILGSLKCDCGQQLAAALQYIEDRKEGIVLYLLQEGRGINIINKLLAYDLQRKGRDTVQTNEDLGLPSELREYGLVKDMLHDLGVVSINLLTNNPDKINKLIGVGVNVEDRISIEIEPIPENAKYLSTKVEKMGHSISYFKS